MWCVQCVMGGAGVVCDGWGRCGVCSVMGGAGVVCDGWGRCGV